MSSEGKETARSYVQVAEEILPDVIQKNFCRTAKLVSWASEEIVKKGDNFVGNLKCIQCQVLIDGQTIEVSYVLKMNPRRPLEMFQKMTESFFLREGKFLNEVTPRLNSILRAANYSPLNVPDCLFVSYKQNEEIILLKDLRKQNFKLFDKMTSMDINHILLIIEELAKQHASSYVLSLQEEQSLQDMFPYMKDWLLNDENPYAAHYIEYCKMRISSAILAMEEMKTFPKVLSWLKREKDTLFNKYVNDRKLTNAKFKVIIHGDCWTNNMLFKYDDNGLPVSVKMLDFQRCRVSSLANDLHDLLMTSTNNNIRIKYKTKILEAYYTTFNNICQSFGNVPFTLSELKEEFLNKLSFGIMTGMVALPLLLKLDVEEDKLSDFNEMDSNSVLKYIERENQNLLAALNSNEILRERYFSLFETVYENGLIT